MPKITIIHPDGNTAKYGLNGPTFTIGRAEGNDIMLPDGAASSHHAVLNMNETGDFTVTDLESTNKTTVNGRAVQTSPLQHGDKLVFGDIEAFYESDIPVSGRYPDDQRTQIYEGTGSPPQTPAAAPASRPAPVTVVPQVIHRPASTTARRSTHSSDGGCFTLIVLGLVIQMAFFVGVVIRHRQEKSQWFWDYLQQYLNS
jgi:hypothetical protein